MLGPPDCQANDYMHVSHRAGCRDGCVMDDAQIKLGDLVHKPGDRLLYTYDFGDGWTHMITVVPSSRHGLQTKTAPTNLL